VGGACVCVVCVVSYGAFCIFLNLHTWSLEEMFTILGKDSCCFLSSK